VDATKRREHDVEAAFISFRELDLLVGEVLPQRVLLSTISDVIGSGVIYAGAPNEICSDDGGGLDMDPAQAAVDTLDHLMTPAHPGGTEPVPDHPQVTPTGDDAGSGETEPIPLPNPVGEGTADDYACQAT